MENLPVNKVKETDIMRENKKQTFGIKKYGYTPTKSKRRLRHSINGLRKIHHKHLQHYATQHNIDFFELWSPEHHFEYEIFPTGGVFSCNECTVSYWDSSDEEAKSWLIMGRYHSGDSNYIAVCPTLEIAIILSKKLVKAATVMFFDLYSTTGIMYPAYDHS
jgi:hypothetical protein